MRKPTPEELEEDLARTDYVNLLQQSIISSDQKAFQVVPAGLETVLSYRLWERKTRQDGRPFRSFEEFVREPLWFGLGKTIPDLRGYCKDRPELLIAIDEAVGPAKGHGGAREGAGRPAKDAGEQKDENQAHNMRLKKGGDSRERILAELKRDAPELAERVASGELTARQAALMAGIRRPKVQVVTDDVELAAATLARHFGRRFPDLIAAMAGIASRNTAADMDGGTP